MITTSQFLRFIRDERAAITAWFVMALMVFLGVAALAVDVSYAIFTRNKLQVTASAAALAGASQLPNPGDVENKALAYAQKNMTSERHGNVLVSTDVTTGTWDPATRTFAPGGGSPDAVRVTTRRAAVNNNPLDLFFGGVVGRAQTEISTTAVAVGGQVPEQVCMLLLDPAAPDTLHLTGTSEINANDCGIHSNSCSPTGLNAQGTPAIVDAPIIKVCADSYAATPQVDFQPNDPITQNPACPADCQIGDPFGEAFLLSFSDGDINDGMTLNDWTLASCDAPVPPMAGSDDHTVPAGVHCGGFQKSGGGNLILESGVHVIRDGTMDIAAANTIIGTDVTIILQNGTIDWAGANNYCLNGSAFPSVPLLFYQDPSYPGQGPGSVTHVMRGDSGAGLGGIIALGMQDIELSGTAQLGAGCSQSTCNAIIARRVETVGTTEIDLASSCGDNLPEIFQGLPIRLVN